jgi:hypothetical protein
MHKPWDIPLITMRNNTKQLQIRLLNGSCISRVIWRKRFSIPKLEVLCINVHVVFISLFWQSPYTALSSTNSGRLSLSIER